MHIYHINTRVPGNQPTTQVNILLYICTAQVKTAQAVNRVRYGWVNYKPCRYSSCEGKTAKTITHGRRKDAFRHAGLEKTVLKMKNTSSISIVLKLFSSHSVIMSPVMK